MYLSLKNKDKKAKCHLILVNLIDYNISRSNLLFSIHIEQQYVWIKIKKCYKEKKI
jgi:hypothetical protein